MSKLIPFLLLASAAAAADTYPMAQGKLILINTSFEIQEQAFVMVGNTDNPEAPAFTNFYYVPANSSRTVAFNVDASTFLYLDAYLPIGGIKQGASLVLNGEPTGTLDGGHGGRIPFSFDDSNIPTTTYRLVGVKPLEDGRKTVWQLGDAELTGDLFREGVDKIVDAAANSKGATAAPAGGGGGETTNSELIAGSQIDALAKVSSLDTVPSLDLQSLTGAGLAAAADYTAPFSAFPAKTDVGFAIEAGGVPAVLLINDPFTGKQYDFNPFTEDRMGGIAGWFRSATTWLVLVLLASWIWNELDAKGHAMSQLSPAKGNPIVGGTGAQATSALVAAGLMAVSITLLVALMAWGFADITMISLYSNLSANPMSGLAGTALWMVDQMFPVSTILTALLAKLAWKMYAVPVWGVAVATARFFVF